MATETMVTTTDNPYDYFTEFDEWYAYDTMHGHHTLAYLARVVRTSNELSQADQLHDIELAIDEIIRENITGLYKKVVKPEAA